MIKMKNDKNEVKKQVIYSYVCYWPDDPAFDPLKIPHFQKTKTKTQRRNVIYVRLYVVVGVF